MTEQYMNVKTRFIQQGDNTLVIVGSDRPDLLNQCYRLRYISYCEDRKTEPENPQGTETDAWDLVSGKSPIVTVSGLVLDKNQMAVGTVRLIMKEQHSGDGLTSPKYVHPFVTQLEKVDPITPMASTLPIDHLYKQHRLATDNDCSAYAQMMSELMRDGKRIAEVSRLCIPRAILREDIANRNAASSVTQSLMALVNYIGASYDVEDMFSVMRPGLERMLTGQGLNFKHMFSKPVEYHGARVVTYFNTGNDIKCLVENDYTLAEMMTNKWEFTPPLLRSAVASARSKRMSVYQGSRSHIATHVTNYGDIGECLPGLGGLRSSSPTDYGESGFGNFDQLVHEKAHTAKRPANQIRNLLETKPN